MKKPLLALTLLAAATASYATDTAYTTPVGGFTHTAAANSDTRISATLARDAVWTGTVGSSTGTTITVNGSPAWTAGAYTPGVNTYYVRMRSGSLRGQYFIVTGNTTEVLTVDPAGMALGSISMGDTLEIAPFWTLGTLFPSNQAGTAFTATTSLFSIQTQILTYDASTTGINRPPTGAYYFYNGAWRKVGSPSATSFDSTILFPDTFVIQRNKASATSLVYTGRVQGGYLGTVIDGATSANDNYVAVSLPIDVTLDQTGLQTSGFAATTSTFFIKDQVLWYDPADVGTNRPPSAAFYYFNGAWRKVGSSSSTDFGNTALKAGGGFIIRKAANGTSSTWSVATGF